MNMEPSTSDEHNTNVGISPTRKFKDTADSDGTIDGFLKLTTPKRIKGSNQHGNPNHSQSTLPRLKI